MREKQRLAVRMQRMNDDDANCRLFNSSSEDEVMMTSGNKVEKPTSMPTSSKSSGGAKNNRDDIPNHCWSEGYEG